MIALAGKTGTAEIKLSKDDKWNRIRVVWYIYNGREDREEIIKVKV
jgi:cell division protein FtsI/penicillin-binding protein 2